MIDERQLRTERELATREIERLCGVLRSKNVEIERLKRLIERIDNQPRLGCATTAELIAELHARFYNEDSSRPEYRTVDGGRLSAPISPTAL